jgi:hypothetical protein
MGGQIETFATTGPSQAKAAPMTGSRRFLRTFVRPFREIAAG